jgi:hydroxymethylpyrimidine pyrophosphatase-like HAD family hydrolase
LGYDVNDVSVGESSKTDVIISDFDGTICNISSTYVYILFILNLICNSFSEKCLKYFKIIILLFLFPAIMIVNVIDSKYAGYISNYIIFNNLNVKQINETVKKIKPNILRKFNMPVINLINSYNTPHKYIISGNSIYILDLICNELNCTIYGSTMEFKENICIGKTINFYLNESKVKCINAILKDKNITNPNIIIFGNDENDYEMFKIGNINYVVNPSSKFLFKLKNLKYNKIIT